MTTGQLIKKARNAAGMTQGQLAQKLNIPYQSISQWERDARNPRYETLEKIAYALGTTVEDMIRNPIKGLDLPSDFPRLEATREALLNWLEQIDLDLKKAKENKDDEHEHTPEELQLMYDLIRSFIDEKEIEVARLKQLVHLEEKRKAYQEQILRTLELLNADATKKVLGYAESLTKASDFRYQPKYNSCGQTQQKIIPIESCELLEFQYEQALAQYQKIKNLPYDAETRADFLFYQKGMWPDVVQYLMDGCVSSFISDGDSETSEDTDAMEDYPSWGKLAQESPGDWRTSPEPEPVQREQQPLFDDKSL